MNRRIPLGLIYGNPDQPRKTFDQAALRELAASIRENGLKQPITVRPDDAGRYMIVMGERRFRAMQLLELADTLCQISKADDQQLAIDAIIENDQRVDVAPLEQAHSYQRMLDEHGFTVDTLAAKLGKQPFRIQERLDLLKLGETAMQLLRSGNLTPERAWYLAKLDDRKQGLLLKAINSGQCATTGQLKAVFDAIREEGSQSALFELPAEASDADRRAAATFEARLEQVAAILRGSIDDDQVVTAVRRVDPNKTGKVADLLGAMMIDMRRLETAFRVAAAGSAMMEV